MSRENPEMRIQDYLDGRMSDAERRAFEAHLARDASLARRVDDYRRAGEALRADPPALSPGFHTRLRARFEAAGRPAPRWFRLLSWETAGIVTAVVLVAAVFTPFLLQQGLDQDAPAAVEPMLELEQQQRLYEHAARPEGQETHGPRSRTAPEEKGQAAKVALDDRVEPEAEEREWAPAPPAVRDLRDAEQKNEPMTDPSDELQGALREEAGTRQDLSAGPPPPVSDEPDVAGDKDDAGASESPSRAAGRRSQAPAQTEVVGAAAAPLQAAPSQEKLEKRDVGDERDSLVARAEGSALASLPPGVGLPAGVVDPGEVVEVADEAGWDALNQGPAAEGIGGFGNYTRGVRIVLIGRRGRAVDCSGTIARLTEGTYEIRLVPPPPGTHEPSHGCAIRLPADGRPFQIIDEEPAP